MRASETDVLIVGAGAAGTMLSLELARYGADARTIDRLPGPAQTSKAITVHARTAELFERIDPALVRRFVERGIHNKGYVLHFIDAAGRRSEVRPGLDFTTIDSAYPYILVHRQSETEQFLREYMEQHFDRRPEWGVACVAVEHTADGVAATLQHADGSDELVRCKYLVACDGINSGVRRALGLAQSEQGYAGTKMQNLDVFLDGFPDVEDYVHYCAGTDHFIMIVKLPGGFFRLLLSDRGEAADPAVEPRRAFANLVDRHFDGVRLGEIVWHSRWESFVRLANTYRDRNVFLAGDSAHAHSTTGGQGMNCCIQDACNLGWKLGLVLAGRAPPDLLDSYETERRPIAEQVIWAASSLHEIFMAHGKDIGERAKRMQDQSFLDAVVGRCSGIDYTYRDSSHASPDATVLTGPVDGDRLADAQLGDGRRIAAVSANLGITLIAVAGDRTSRESLERHVHSLQRIYGDSVTAVTGEPSAQFEARYGSCKDGQILAVRPDGYIGCRRASASAAALDIWLSATLAARETGHARGGVSGISRGGKGDD